TMAPTTGFGETFQYSNALVSAGGFAAARARYPELPLLEAYEKALKDTVLRPLGLTATTYRTNTVTKTDHAMPYGRGLDGRYSPIPLSYEGAVTSVVPAGGLWSNLKDMTKVMQMELANGKFGGEQLFEGENLLRRRVPGIKIGEKSHYGLALFVADNRGLQMYGHGGNTLGFTTLNDFYPEHGLGFVILSNGAGANTLTNAIERRTIELLFDARPEAESNLTFAVKNQAEAWANLEPKLAVPPPAAWAAPLVGDYSNEALGPLQVRKDGDGYVVDVGEWKSSTALYAEAGSKLLMLVDPPVAGLPLIPQADGSLLLDVGQQRYSFAPVQKTSSRR
ncbi:MAG: serine hydrolase domain-containing protein, partial [Myxococcota bacterium]